MKIGFYWIKPTTKGKEAINWEPAYWDGSQFLRCLLSDAARFESTRVGPAIDPPEPDKEIVGLLAQYADARVSIVRCSDCTQEAEVIFRERPYCEDCADQHRKER